MPAFSSLFPIPVLAQVLIVFAIIVIASARKVHLGLAALAGGLIFAILRGIPAQLVVRVTIGEILDLETILLLTLIASILAISNAMKNSDALAAFTRAVALVAPAPRASLTLTPLLIGTLPMPGGAILSAPLVDALDPERRQGADGLATVNFWFRHALELSWPLYPAFILTSILSGIPTARLIVLNLYSFVLLILLGQIFVIKRGLLPSYVRPGKFSTRDLSALGGFLPLAIILGVFIGLDALGRAFIPGLGLSAALSGIIVRYVPILIGVGAASLFVALTNRGRHAFRGSVNGASVKLLLVIAGVRVFAVLLETGGVADSGAAELAAWGIPAIFVAVLLPFVSGLVTGVGFAYVGISLPIVIGLFPAGSSFPREAVVVLAGAFGFAGMMLSPLHVCMVVTAEHFGTGLVAMIRRFALPMAIFLALASVYSALLARIIGN